MADYVLVPISQVPFGAFTAAFNDAYSDYFTPIVMTEASFHALIERDDLDLDRSVAALEGDTVVGTGLLGIRADTGWIGGMGVRPAYRRRGIARLMLHYLLREAQRQGLSTVSLEAIEANTPAQALYLQLGFRPVRHLHVLERQPQPIAVPAPQVRVSPASPWSLLANYHTFHDTANCWQRGYRSLRGLADRIQGVEAWDGALSAYALGWFDAQEIRFVDLATEPSDPARRTATALALLTALHRQYVEAPGRAYNIAEDDPALAAFLTIGYTTSFRQIEMKLDVTGR